MKTIILITLIMFTTMFTTACDDGRYSGLRLWEPGTEDHEDICGLYDWKTGEVLPVESVPATAWDHSDWAWVPREGCPQ